MGLTRGLVGRLKFWGSSRRGLARLHAHPQDSGRLAEIGVVVVAVEVNPATPPFDDRLSLFDGVGAQTAASGVLGVDDAAVGAGDFGGVFANCRGLVRHLGPSFRAGSTGDDLRGGASWRGRRSHFPMVRSLCRTVLDTQAPS